MLEVSRMIVHLTSVHPRDDMRIFHKECRSLAKAGYEVALIVADGLPDETKSGIRIHGVEKAPGRLTRIIGVPRKVLQKALALDADVYHLHDPELLTIALKLKLAGKHVVFDAHEDLPKQILAKSYLWKPMRRAIAALAKWYETLVCRRLTAVVAATPTIRDKFLPINANTIDVNNFPMLGELESAELRLGDSASVCYVGGIAEARGINELVQAMDMVESGVRLALCGTFEVQEVSDRVRRMAGWKRVDELGWQGRDGVRRTMASSLAGLVTLHPTPSYMEALPVKMFEYMSAGLPVIASDFPLWRKIIDGSECGLCVDPLDPSAIAQAIDALAANPEEARRIGENGKRAVESRYNWGVEENKLLRLYENMTS